MLETVEVVKKIAEPTRTQQAGSNSKTGGFGRRSFLKRLGLGGTALVPGAGLLASTGSSRAQSFGGLTFGDAAILRFAAAAEIIETDLWQQYTELALGNVPFLRALQSLDGDMPTYVNQNTRDERSHEKFLNAYLMSKGAQPVSLDAFRRLPSSQATGSNKSAKRLTNLMNLTVDTSWFLRYRSPGNPDFGDSFAQIVSLVNTPAIPNGDLPLGSDDIQVIANTAGFHFATIEQGGASLYTSFLHKVTSPEVARIVGSIGGTEVMHFELWQDKAGNAPAVPGRFPQLPVAPNDPTTGNTFFPGDGTDPSQPDFTNQVMPAPCTFINPNLPLCSVIRPTLTIKAGATAAANGLKASGLFSGQQDDFFDALFELAEQADAASRLF